MTCFVPAIFVVGLTASSDKVGNHVFRSTGAKMSALVGISWRSRDMHQSIASASLDLRVKRVENGYYLFIPN